MNPVHKWKFSNGLTFLYRQSPGFPLAAATLVLPVGSRHELPQEAGLASLSSELMMQGTRQRSARRIAEEVESVGGWLGSQTAEDYSELGFMCPVPQLQRLLDILADLLTQPAFPNEEIKKERAQAIAALKSRQDSLFTFAYDLLNARMYPEHPYGRPVDGIESTVKRFTREDFKRWHQTHIRPDGAILSIVASLPASEVRKRVENCLKPWRKPEHIAPGLFSGIFPLTRSVQHRATAPFEQAYYMTAMMAPAVGDPDYLALKVLNTLLGGGMSSRLFMRLREDLGLAYEVSSFFPTHLLGSQWGIYLGLPAARLSLAKKELHKLLDALAKKGPRPEEVKQAVAMIKGSFVMEHQTRRRQAWYAAWWEFLGKPLHYDQAFMKSLDRITPAQLKTLTRRLLSQPRVTIEVAPKK